MTEIRNISVIFLALIVRLISFLMRFPIILIPLFFGLFRYLRCYTVSDSVGATVLLILTLLLLYLAFFKTLSEYTVIGRLKNEYMTSLRADYMKFRKDHKGTRINDAIAVEYIKGLKKYCNVFSFNKLIRRPVRIRTFENIINAMKNLIPEFDVDIGKPKMKSNIVKVFFMKYNVIFHRRGVELLNKQQPYYTFKIPHDKLMELNKVLESEKYNHMFN